MTADQLAAVLLGLSVAWGAAVACVWQRFGLRYALLALLVLAGVVWAAVVAAAGAS